MDPASPTDAALMEALQAGRIKALAALHERHAGPVTALLRRLSPGRSPDEAEDLCQEVFLTLWERRARYREGGQLRSWLYGIAVRKVRGAARRRAMRDLLLLRFSPRGAGVAAAPAGPEARVESRELLEQALASLPAAQRELLVLSAIEGLSGAELATVLGVKPGTVWVRLHRARAALAERLQRLGARTSAGADVAAGGTR